MPGHSRSNPLVISIILSVVDGEASTLLAEGHLEGVGAAGGEDGDRHLVGRHVGVDGALQPEEVVSVWTDGLHSHPRMVVVVGGEERTDAVDKHSAHR
jgi:hypothetical protein